MSVKGMALGIGVVLSIIYTILALVAYSSMREDEKNKEDTRFLAFTFWWPLYDVYEKSVNKIRIIGIIVLLAAMISYGVYLKSSC